MRCTLALTLLVGACSRPPSCSVGSDDPAERTKAGAKQSLHEQKLAAWGGTMEDVRLTRAAFAEAWEGAQGDEDRARIREQAREYVVRTIADEILPAWLGTPWTMYAVQDGLTPDAALPHEEGKGTSCSYFVATVLENAGLVLDTRKKFAGAIAVTIQKSLVPPEHLHRYWNTTPEELEEKLSALGGGIHVIGLNCHVGFVVVTDDDVRFVHASYLDPWMVVDERLRDSEAIALSENSGYVVTPLFRDDALVEKWITGAPVTLDDP